MAIVEFITATSAALNILSRLKRSKREFRTRTIEIKNNTSKRIIFTLWWYTQNVDNSWSWYRGSWDVRPGSLITPRPDLRIGAASHDDKTPIHAGRVRISWFDFSNPRNYPGSG